MSAATHPAGCRCLTCELALTIPLGAIPAPQRELGDQGLES